MGRGKWPQLCDDMELFIIIQTENSSPVEELLLIRGYHMSLAHLRPFDAAHFVCAALLSSAVM